MNKDIVVMFSGGLDSTAVVLLLLKQNYKVHMLTYNNGLCVKLSSVNSRVEEFVKKYNKKNIIHYIIDTKDTISFLKKHYKNIQNKTKSPLLFDLMCKFAMEINTVLYCKRNNISLVADGNNFAQNQIFLQQKEYLNVIDNFYNFYEIKSIHPIFFVKNKKESLNYLKKENMNIAGSKFFPVFGISSQFLHQPFCLWAFVSFLFTSPLRKIGFEKFCGLNINDAIETRKYLQKYAVKYIEEKLNDKLGK